MRIREAIAELKAFRADCKTGAKPRQNSLHGQEVELAVKAAQEDVCANIDLAITAMLVATGCPGVVCIVAACWTAAQFVEATKWEVLLRLERAKKLK